MATTLLEASSGCSRRHRLDRGGNRKLNCALHRIAVTDDLFRCPPVEIEQTVVQTVSPLALYQIREAFVRLGTFGPPREKDITVQAQIKSRFFDDQDPGVLAPPIRPLVPDESL